MTVDSIASQYYNQYALANQDSMPFDPSTVSEQEYGISDLTSALDAVGAANTDSFSISNVSQYAQNILTASQLSENDMLKEMENNFCLTGSLSNAVGLSTLSGQYGIDSGSVDLDGITNLDSYANDKMESYAVSQYSNALSNYQNYLNGDSVGSLLDYMG